MLPSERKSKVRYRGKYQLLMQGVILTLLFITAFVLLFFSASFFIQRSRNLWIEQQKRMAWYERDGFRTRLRLVNTEIEALTADSDIRAFAEMDNAYSYSTIKAYRKLFRNTVFFSAPASSLQVTTAFPEARVVGAEGSMSKAEYIEHELRLSPAEKAQLKAFMEQDKHSFMQMALADENGELRELLRVFRRSTRGHDIFFMSRLEPGFFLQYHGEHPFILLNADGTLLADSGAEADSLKAVRLLDSLGEEREPLLKSEDPEILEGPERTQMVIYHLPDTSLTIVIFPGDMPRVAPYIILLLMAFIPVFLLLTWFLSRTISQRLYRPIEVALGPLQENEEALPEEAEEGRLEAAETGHHGGGRRLDEIELITRRLENYRQIAKEFNALQKEHSLYQDSHFYSNLLEGVVLPQYRGSELLQTIEEGRHTVAILEFAETNYTENIVIYQEVQTVFRSDPDCRLLNEGIHRFILLYLNTPQSEADRLLRTHLDEIKPAVPWYAAISETREGSKGLELSQRECLQLIDFRYRLPENNFLYAKDLPAVTSNYYYYPVNEEQRLTRLIVDGNEDALALFDKLWRDNIVQRALGAEARRDFVLALVHTFRRSAQELKINLNQLPTVRHDLAELIETHWQEPEIVQDLRDLLTALLSYKNVRGSSEDEILKEKMFNFIAKNYYDDIMLNDLADYLGLSPKYCSALFAKLLDTNFKEFLNRYRITQATRILKEDPDILVNDLAATVGFNSANSFIRVFRRFTGTTPGRYMKEEH